MYKQVKIKKTPLLLNLLRYNHFFFLSFKCWPVLFLGKNNQFNGFFNISFSRDVFFYNIFIYKNFKLTKKKIQPFFLNAKNNHLLLVSVKNNKQKFFNYIKSFQFNNFLITERYIKVNSKLLVTRRFPKWQTTAVNTSKMFFWEDYYNVLPLSSFFNKKITVINFNIASVFFEKSFASMLQRALKFYPFLQLNRVVAKLLASIFSILVLKETKALTYFIQSIMQEEHYSKHMLFFGFAGQLIYDVFTPWIHRFGCLGVGIVFRGKLAVGGNSRKRALKYKTGMLSSSSKFVKINRTFLIVRTKTGAVGFSVTVAW